MSEELDEIIDLCPVCHKPVGNGINVTCSSPYNRAHYDCFDSIVRKEVHYTLPKDRPTFLQHLQEFIK